MNSTLRSSKSSKRYLLTNKANSQTLSQASSAILDDLALIADELKDQGYTYESLLERREDYAAYLVTKGTKRYLCKIYPKKQVFTNHVAKSLVNRETEIADQIKRNFNYLVGYLDFFYTRNLVGLVYEYCTYGSLRTLLAYGNLTEAEAYLIMKDVFNALEELKFLGIVHRNLSPDYIMIDDKFSLKIHGYEFCELHSHKTLSPPDYLWFTTKGIRDPDSVPPEALFNKVCTFKTPLYSLGSLLYALFHSGRFPFAGESVEQVKVRLANNDTQVKLEVPPAQAQKLKSLLNGMLQVDARDRMSFVEVREFLNAEYLKIKHEEEIMRSQLIGKIKNIKEKLNASKLDSKKGGKQADIDLKKYTSIFETPLPAPAAIKKSFKIRGYGEKYVKQTLKLVESCRRTDIDDEYEMQTFPLKHPLYNEANRIPAQESLGMTQNSSFFRQSQSMTAGMMPKLFNSSHTRWQVRIGDFRGAHLQKRPRMADSMGSSLEGFRKKDSHNESQYEDMPTFKDTIRPEIVEPRTQQGLNAISARAPVPTKEQPGLQSKFAMTSRKEGPKVFNFQGT